jgi:hypothetical protein
LRKPEVTADYHQSGKKKRGGPEEILDLPSVTFDAMLAKKVFSAQPDWGVYPGWRSAG